MARHEATVCFESRLGPIEIEAAPEGVTRVRLGGRSGEREVGSGPALEQARAAQRQIQAYLAGALRTFTVPVAVDGTRFQQAVWVELRRIPYGQSVSYGTLAARVGNPRAARAVGAACAANPVPLLVPCHRVVGGQGTLGGFSAGVDVKQTLLALEQEVAAGGEEGSRSAGEGKTAGPAAGPPGERNGGQR